MEKLIAGARKHMVKIVSIAIGVVVAIAAAVSDVLPFLQELKGMLD